MRKIVILFLTIAIYNVALTQEVYPLHPSVGDTIDLQEKLDYSLFDQYDNKLFQQATIEYEKDHFVLLVTEVEENEVTGEVTEIVITNDLSQENIISEQKKIQKINAYYKYLAEEAKKPKESDIDLAKNKNAHSIPMRKVAQDKMKKEARMMIRLKEDQRRSREFEMGLRPRQVRLELGR